MDERGGGREGKGREGKGREGKGREGKGREGKGREGKGREGKGREESTVFIKGLRTMERWIWRDGLGWMDGSRRVR